MNEDKIRAKYLTYILSRCAYPYEDIPNDKTMDYETFKKSFENSNKGGKQ